MILCVAVRQDHNVASLVAWAVFCLSNPLNHPHPQDLLRGVHIRRLLTMIHQGSDLRSSGFGLLAPGDLCSLGPMNNLGDGALERLNSC